MYACKEYDHILVKERKLVCKMAYSNDFDLYLMPRSNLSQTPTILSAVYHGFSQSWANFKLSPFNVIVIVTVISFEFQKIQ
jgi:hypothetical protein